MKKLIYLLLIATSFLSCNRKEPEITRKLDSIIRNYVDSSEFTGSVLIAKNDEVLLKKGYGYANIEKKIPNTPSTNFYLASVSKLFTIAAIVQLKDKGLLSLEDSLTKFIPDYPNGNQITIRQLIDHNSGIVDFVNERPYEFIDYEIDIESIIDTFKYLPLNFTPGEKYSYSGSGYILLAFIVEKVSGMKYSDYIEKEIFEKLDMKNSYANWNKLPKNQAQGYFKEDGNFLPGKYFHPSQFVGAGELSSTVEDMYKWYNAIFKTNKISLECQRDHIGRIGAWTSTDFYPVFASDYAIILLSNYGDAPVVEIANEIREALDEDGENYQTATSSSLEKYCGNYTIGDNFYIQIEKGDNCLISHANDSNDNVYTDTVWKVTENEFKHPNMRLTFLDKGSNGYGRVFVFWGGDGYVYQRSDEKNNEK